MFLDMRNSKRRRVPRRHRRFLVEPFEPRLLLSANPLRDDVGTFVSAVESNPIARFRMEVTDERGDTVWEIHARERFLLSVYVADLRSEAQGVFSAYLDLHFDASRAARFGGIEFGGHYGNAVNHGGARPGVLDEVGGFSASLKPLGEGEFLLFQQPFRAERAGPISFVASPADSVPQSLVLLYGEYGPLANRDIEFGSLSLNVLPTARPVLPIHPVVSAGSPLLSNANSTLGGYPAASFSEQIFMRLSPILPSWVKDELQRPERVRTAMTHRESSILDVDRVVQTDRPREGSMLVWDHPDSGNLRASLRDDTSIELDALNVRRFFGSALSRGYSVAVRPTEQMGNEMANRQWPGTQSWVVISGEWRWQRAGFRAAKWETEPPSIQPPAVPAMLDLGRIAYEATWEGLDLLEEQPNKQEEAAATDLIFAGEVEVEIEPALGAMMAFEVGRRPAQAESQRTAEVTDERPPADRSSRSRSEPSEHPQRPDDTPAA